MGREWQAKKQKTTLTTALGCLAEPLNSFNHHSGLNLHSPPPRFSSKCRWMQLRTAAPRIASQPLRRPHSSTPALMSSITETQPTNGPSSLSRAAIIRLTSSVLSNSKSSRDMACGVLCFSSSLNHHVSPPWPPHQQAQHKSSAEAARLQLQLHYVLLQTTGSLSHPRDKVEISMETDEEMTGDEGVDAATSSRRNATTRCASIDQRLERMEKRQIRIEQNQLALFEFMKFKPYPPP